MYKHRLGILATELDLEVNSFSECMIHCKPLSRAPKCNFPSGSHYSLQSLAAKFKVQYILVEVLALLLRVLHLVLLEVIKLIKDQGYERSGIFCSQFSRIVLNKLLLSEWADVVG